MNNEARYYKNRLEKQNKRLEREKDSKKIAITIGGLALLAATAGNQAYQMMEPKDSHTEAVISEEQRNPTLPSKEILSTPQEIPIPVIDLAQYEESFIVHVRGSIPNSANFYRSSIETE